MLRKPLAILIAASTLVAILAIRGTTSADIDDIYANRMTITEAVELQAQAVAGDNLLINGDFDQLAFYPRPTNHYVAGMWYEWWGNNDTIPEYIDGGIPGHSECYPKPADGRCHNPDTGYYNSSQGYIRWGAPFVAGIYQPVTENIVPCTLYTFEIWNRNDSNTYGAKVGIDPTGWVITRLGNSRPDNCPPDGASRCPDPYIGDDHGFPSTIVWSAPSYHDAYTWAPLSLTVEAAADTVSVWTYAAPDYSGPQSTYWDYGTLVQVPFPDDKLPAPASWVPTGYVQNLQTTFVTPTLTIEWTTLTPASTQVLFNLYPAPISPTTGLSQTVYMPMISKPDVKLFLDTTPKQEHRFTLSGLRSGDEIEFVALSRQSLGDSCATETSGPMRLIVGSGAIVPLNASEGPRIYAGTPHP